MSSARLVTTSGYECNYEAYGLRSDSSKRSRFSTDEEVNEGSLSWKMVLKNKDRVGMVLSYLVVGFLYGTAMSLVYPVYNVYLKSGSTLINTVNSFITLGFSLKVFYGFASDSIPICGQRRRPYLIIGWVLTFCATLGVALYLYLHPSTDYCFPAFAEKFPADSVNCTGQQIYSMPDFDGFTFGLFLLVQNLMYMFADVSMDSLSIEWAIREPLESRGQIQSNNYVSRSIGFMFSSLFIGFGLNYAPFGGSFSSGMSLQLVFVIQCIVIALPFPYYYLLKEEATMEEIPSVLDQCKSILTLLSGKAYGCLILFEICFGLCLFTSAVGQNNVSSVWIQMSPVIRGVNNVWAYIVMMITLWVSGRYLRNVSWRLIQSLSVIFAVLVGLLYIPIVYDVTRSPWYYIFVNMDSTIVQNIGYLVCLWACNELTILGLEGTAYALTTTATNVVITISNVYITNAIGTMYPDLETLTGPTVQHDYMMNYMIVSFVNLAALLFLPLLPKQKKHAQERKEGWGSNRNFGIALMSLSLFLILFSLVTTFGSMICPGIKFFGGTGQYGCSMDPP